MVIETTSYRIMKKTIILALALALPAMAGDGKSAPVTVVDVPIVAPPPAPACGECGVEVGAVYTAALNDIVPGVDGINTWGVDVTGVHEFTPNLAGTVRVGWAVGSDSYPQNGDYVSEDIDVENWTIAVGLRYSAPITESLSWYVGGEIGLAYSVYESTIYWDPGDVEVEDFDGWGFAYGIEAGLRYNITPCMYVYGSVHYSGNFAEADFGGGDYYYSDTAAQAGYGVRMGLGVKF